jgi:hypothetical protein
VPDGSRPFAFVPLGAIFLERNVFSSPRSRHAGVLNLDGRLPQGYDKQSPMNTTVTMAWEILDRMERAVAKVRERLLRATAVLNQAGIPYAVVGGHAGSVPVPGTAPR